MIDLYTWTTPNGRKVSIALEELGLPYRAIAVDITKDEQFRPDFLAISPNNKIPAIVDHDTGLSLMESGAILVYLAEKTGKLLPPEGERRYRCLEWLNWQMGGFGPMLGQAHHFLKYNPGVAPYAEERFGTEAQRLYRVLDQRLEGRDFVADDYSIADIAIWPWVRNLVERYKAGDLVGYAEFTEVQRVVAAFVARPAVAKGLTIPAAPN